MDQSAIQLAREKYKEKMAQEPISKEVDDMSDEQFLTKMKLLIGGKVTNAAMLLLGNSDFDYLFTAAPSIMWRLYGVDGTDKDYAIFKIPFINVVDKVFAKVRNLTYRYMPNQMTLFPAVSKDVSTQDKSIRNEEAHITTEAATETVTTQVPPTQIQSTTTESSTKKEYQIKESSDYDEFQLGD